MSQQVSDLAPTYNVGPRGGGPWLQKGLTYGQNDSGYFKRIETRGDIASVEADSQQYFQAGWEVTIKYEIGGSGAPGPGIATMEANTSWGGPGVIYSGETVFSTWELDAQTTDKGLLEADFPYSYTAIGQQGIADDVNLTSAATATCGGSAATKLAIQSALNAQSVYWGPTATPPVLIVPNGGGTTYQFDDGANGPYSATVIPLPSADYAPAYSLYKLMAAGVTQFPIRAPIIRNTQLFSNLYSTQVSFSYVGQLLSSASLISKQGVPSTLIFEVNNNPAFSLTPTQFIETPGDLQYAWLKDNPAVSRVSLTKYKTTTNFQFGLWPIRLYGAVN